MKVFLLDMSKSKVNKDALDNCGILEYTENYDDSVEVVHAVNDVTEKINDEIETDATTTTTIHELPGKDSRSVDTNEDSTFDEDSVVYDTDHDKIYQILNINQPDDATNDNANENKVFDSDKDSNDATASTEAAERLHSDPLSSSSPRIFIHSVISSLIPVALIFVTAIL